MKSVPSPRSLCLRARALLFLPLAALLFPSPAQAQKKNWLSGRLDLFTEAGGSFFNAGPTFAFTTFPPLALNTSKLSLQNSAKLFVGADLRFTRHDIFELSYSYNSADITDTFQKVFPSPGQPYSYSFPLREHILSADYLRMFPVTKHWEPFLAAGIGKASWYGLAQSHFSTNLGGGVEYGLSSRWAIRAEDRTFITRFPGNDGISYNQAPMIGPVFRF